MHVWRGAVRRLLDPPTNHRHDEDDYELLADDDRDRDRDSPLPHHHNHHHTHHHSRSSHSRSLSLPLPSRRACLPRTSTLLFSCKSCSLRRLLTSLLLFPLLVTILALIWGGIPPDYDDIRGYERRLAQHNLSLPFPEGEDGLYLRFPGHLWGHGLNNILQETILMSYLAYMANRSFVFEDYVWSHTPLPYTIYDFALRPKRIPLNAFISGPTAGGPISLPAPSSPSSSHTTQQRQQTTHPRAISAEWWETVCPKWKRRVVSSKDAPNDEEGDVLIDWWIRMLADVSEGCVEVDSSSQIVFDRFLFGSPRILSIWPSLSTSPILQSYTWSPLVQSAVSRNFALLQPISPKSLFDISSKSTLTGLVAVHLRRGDYKRHCPRLAGWDAAFMGLNQFPSLPDKFYPSLYPSSSSSRSSQSSSPLPPSQPPTDDPHARESYYLQHCLPTIPQIVSKLHQLRDEHPSLRRVYVLSNGWGWWLNGLKGALQKDGWDDLKSSLDLRLDGEQGYVAMAVDMAIAEKAEVFVGNGFSSLSSNVVMLRMAKGLDPSTNRFL